MCTQPHNRASPLCLWSLFGQQIMHTKTWHALSSRREERMRQNDEGIGTACRLRAASRSLGRPVRSFYHIIKFPEESAASPSLTALPVTPAFLPSQPPVPRPPDASSRLAHHPDSRSAVETERLSSHFCLPFSSLLLPLLSLSHVSMTDEVCRAKLII